MEAVTDKEILLKRSYNTISELIPHLINTCPSSPATDRIIADLRSLLVAINRVFNPFRDFKGYCNCCNTSFDVFQIQWDTDIYCPRCKASHPATRP